MNTYKYVARDKSGAIFCYEHKPRKVKGAGWTCDKGRYLFLGKFQGIPLTRWQDSRHKILKCNQGVIQQ